MGFMGISALASMEGESIGQAVQPALRKSDGAESESVSMYSHAFNSFLDSCKEEKGLRMPLSSGAVTVKYERYAGGENRGGEGQFCSVEALCRKRQNV